MVIDWQQQQTKAAIFRSYHQVFFSLNNIVLKETFQDEKTFSQTAT